MADPVLHIKDSYYFEVPKPLWPVHHTDKSQFPNVWVKNDDQFQEWEAERLYRGLQGMAGSATLPDEHELIHEWQHWQHAAPNHANFAAPFDVYLESIAGTKDGEWFAKLIQDDAGKKKWTEVKEHAGGDAIVTKFKKNELKEDESKIKWSEQKIAAYNDHLSGKILLEPQPFGTLRNFYEAESGFCISKYMIIEVVVGIVLFVVFSWVAGKVRSGNAPKGRLWNLFEVFLLFIRDQIARPALGASHDEHEHDHEHDPHHHKGDHPTGVASGHAEGGAGLGGPPIEVDDIHHHHAQHKKQHAREHYNPYADADRFVPLLWTIFFFVLFCNLFGMLPWLGAPTASFGTTFALAMVTFATVVIAGMIKFGFIGFFLNQIPSMDLPWYAAIILKPMIFAIEMLGLLIKHLVLSIRLLANMVAGHLVILGVMGLAFGAQAALNFSSPDVPAWQWPLVATIAVVGSTLFNVLELFVAFLQAYVFTFLSALFIGAAVHKH
jgi:F-type H+-transporting ATPase subunit a